MVRSEGAAATPGPTCHLPLSGKPPERPLILRHLPHGRRDGRKQIPSTSSSTPFPRTHHAAPPQRDHGVAAHPRRSPPPAPPRRWRPSFLLVRGPNLALRALVQVKLSFSETVLSLLPHLVSWHRAVKHFGVLVDPVVVNFGCFCSAALILETFVVAASNATCSFHLEK